jgi:hypothetical protein
MARQRKVVRQGRLLQHGHIFLSPWRLVCDRFPELEQILDDAGAYVLEIDLNTSLLWAHRARGRALPLADRARKVVEETFTSLPTLPEKAPLLVAFVTRHSLALELVGLGVALPRGTFVGALGVFEGGAIFVAPDGALLDFDTGRQLVMEALGRQPKRPLVTPRT